MRVICYSAVDQSGLEPLRLAHKVNINMYNKKFCKTFKNVYL